MTEPGGAAWRQTIFYPYLFASLYGRGEALQLSVDSPGYDTQVADNVPYLDIAGVQDAQGGTVTFFAVNRHPSETLDLDVDLQGFEAVAIKDHQTMAGAALDAMNTLKRPTAVQPRAGTGAKFKDGRLTARLPPHSYQMLRLAAATG
jgi:alpha-N-arabinofuranosidase